MQTDPRIVPGELLWPARFGPAEVAELKGMGAYAYSGQYQQRPSPAEGGMLKRAWWKRYPEIQADPRLWPDWYRAPDDALTSWDCAFKDNKNANFVVGTCWYRKGSSMYLVGLVRGRLDFPATCAAIRDFARKHSAARGHLIEDKANGTAVIATLAKEIPGIIAINPEGGKEARANAAARALEAGNIWIPESAPWVGDFIEECAVFPKGQYDDQVDSFSQAVLKMLAGPVGYVAVFSEDF